MDIMFLLLPIIKIHDYRGREPGKRLLKSVIIIVWHIATIGIFAVAYSMHFQPDKWVSN